jgi:TPR repeat protein
VSSLPLRKRVHKISRLAQDVPLKPKVVVLGLSKAQPPETHPAQFELDSALRQAVQQTGASGAAMALGIGADLYCRATLGTAPPVGTHLDPESGLTGLCFRTGKVLLCRDTEQDSRVDAVACRALNVRSVLVIPLRKVGVNCGVLELFSALPETFNESNVEAVGRIANRLLGNELQPRAAQEKSEECSREEVRRPRMEPRFVYLKHSPWSRTAIAAALISAGVMGYGAKLRHIESHFAEQVKVIKPADNHQPTPARAKQVSVAASDLAHTAGRIQGNISSSDLNAVRVRASTGNPRAAYDLGERYADGAGVEQDYQQAMKWFVQAADKGDASAQWKLGLGYLKGIGVPQDDNKAAGWFIRAANQAHIGAQMALSELYFNGRGVPRDYVRAYTWATIAAQTTNQDNNLLDDIADQMTSEQLAEAQHRVTIWWQRRARPMPR